MPTVVEIVQGAHSTAIDGAQICRVHKSAREDGGLCAVTVYYRRQGYTRFQRVSDAECDRLYRELVTSMTTYSGRDSYKR